MPANRPHYHVWLRARTGRIYYRLARGFHTRQAASKYAQRRQPEPGWRMVIQCEDERCKPAL